MKDIKKALNTLHSNSFQERSWAVETLMISRDPYELKQIYDYIKTNLNNDSNIIIIGLCEEILKEDDISICHHPIKILNIIINESNHILSMKAKDAMDHYFRDLNIIEGHKAITINKAWDEIIPEHRAFLVSVIRKYKYHSLVNLLLSNFQHSIDDLLIDSIYALNDLKETRGNRYFRESLVSSNIKILEAAIFAIGNNGVFWDGFKIKQFISHPNEKIKMVSISALRKIFNNHSLSILSSVFQRESYDVKKVVLDEVTYLKSTKALTFLLKLLDSTQDMQLLNLIEWNIYNLQTKKKIATILKFYLTAKDITKYRLLNILGDFDDEKCRLHFIHTISSEAPIMLKSISIHQLVHYKDRLTLLFLKAFVKSEPNRILRYSALKTLLNTGKENAHETIDWLLKNQDELNDEVIMLIVKNLKTQSHTLQNDTYSLFLFEIMQTGSKDTQLAVLSLFTKHHNEEIFYFLIELYHDTEYAEIKDFVLLSLLHILITFPYYLNTHNIDEEYRDLVFMIDPYKANFQLLIHLARLDLLINEQNIVADYVEEHKEAITLKLNYILNKGELTLDDVSLVIKYLCFKKMDINHENLEYIINEHFDILEQQHKIYILQTIIKSSNPKFYRFMVEYYFAHEKVFNENQIPITSYFEAII